jgi:hypothetical protein
MLQGNGITIVDARRSLAERIAASKYLNRSARLRDLLLYLTERAIEDENGEVHEQEVGHNVFGRPANYDTTSDNIVRVHASMLRKRLEQYFAAEGAGEHLILAIPKGNYSPIFREREEPLPEVLLAPQPLPEPVAPPDRRIWALTALCIVLAASTAWLLFTRTTSGAAAAGAAPPTVRAFWSQVFRPGHATDVVLDDAAVGLFQELTGKPVSLSDYFDREYLRGLPGAATASTVDAQAAAAIVHKRQTSFANVSFLWKLSQVPGIGRHFMTPRFARDYSFRELKADNAVLLGASRSNPWIEPFEPKMGLRWNFDQADGLYYPIDTRPGGQTYRAADGYFSITLLPNLGGGGNVLVVGSTGGSAINAGAEFLADEQALAALRKRLPPAKDQSFPYFEALVRIKGRSAQPREAAVVICRPTGQ